MQTEATSWITASRFTYITPAKGLEVDNLSDANWGNKPDNSKVLVSTCCYPAFCFSLHPTRMSNLLLYVMENSAVLNNEDIEFSLIRRVDPICNRKSRQLETLVLMRPTNPLSWPGTEVDVTAAV